MNINEIIKNPEGRRLEFKSELPENADLAKTIMAFANDVGGELYIGIGNNPRKIVGIAEDELIAIEEKVRNIIYDRCYLPFCLRLNSHFCSRSSSASSAASLFTAP